jgi:hypothetical protein
MLLQLKTLWLMIAPLLFLVMWIKQRMVNTMLPLNVFLQLMSLPRSSPVVSAEGMAREVG